MSERRLQIFFNFRSPYCYLASRSMFDVFAQFEIPLAWQPLGGWDGRSPPERAKSKLPIARQDVARWCKRLNIGFEPPPVTTDPTIAALGSLAAEASGQLAPYVIETMTQEWSHGRDIGDPQVMYDVCGAIGLERKAFDSAVASKANRQTLEENWSKASAAGVFGVPSFVVDDQIFWGNDRLDFLAEHLTELGLKK